MISLVDILYILHTVGRHYIFCISTVHRDVVVITVVIIISVVIVVSVIVRDLYCRIT